MGWLSDTWHAVTAPIVNVAKAVVKVVSSVVTAVVNVVASVVNFIASPFMGLLGGMPAIPDASAEAQRQSGVLIQQNGGGAVSIPVVYGYRKLAGVVTFCETGSTNNKYLWVAYTFCEGLVEGINEIWLDDVQLSVANVQGLNSGNIVSVADTKYKGRVQFQWFPGVYFNSPSSSPVGTTSILKDAPSWKTSMVYNGTAVLMARYEFINATTQAEADANPFNGSIPTVQLSIMGKRVAPLVSGISTENYTYGGSGYTERYSTNPAECLLDYLRNPRYGKGLANADIDWTSFYSAAAKCNEQIYYTSSVRGPILTMNIVLDTAQTLFANVKNMLQNFRGYLPYVQGKYKLKIEDAGGSSILSGAAAIAGVFNRDNIIGNVQYTGIERTSKYNQVVITYVDPDQKFSTQQVVYPETEAERQIYIGYDGGRENKAEVTMSGITNVQIAKDMARLIFNKSRYQETCSLSVGAGAFVLEPGDNIYIQSNILNFGTVPWRIISMKLNQNYTFDLSCVRNPDFIYPYVTPNTPDYIIAPYVPQGATITVPLSGGQFIGLFPPVTAPLLAGLNYTPNNPLTNPSTTIPTGSAGGGVGGATGSVNVSGGSTPTTPTTAIELTDFVTIDNIKLTYPSTGVAFADIQFKQPSNSMYQSLTVYYKFYSAAETVWQSIEITDKPGAGGTISFKIGPLIAAQLNNSYQLRTRVKYTTGQLSTRVGTAAFVTGNGLTSIDPSDSVITVSQGWTLDTNAPTRRDDYIGTLNGAYLLTAGAPRTPRALSFTTRQDVTANPINSDIAGIKLYYKLSTNTFWKEAKMAFGPDYVPGGTYTVSLADFGVPTTPQNYSMIFRYYYKDGSESTIQKRTGSTRVEYGPGSSVDYASDPFYPTIGSWEYASSYSFQTEAQGIATGALANVKDMNVAPAGVFVYGASLPNTINIVVFKPDNSVIGSWLGVRVYRRPLSPGLNAAYTTRDYIQPTNNVNYTQPAATLTMGDVTWDQSYQYIITPLVLDSGGATVEGNYSWYGVASLTNNQARADYPATGDWSPLFNWRKDTTSALKGQLTTVLAQTTASVIVSNYSVNNATPSITTGIVKVGSVYTLQYYYRVIFGVGHIPDLTKVHIWRRHNGTIQAGYAPYYGLGRWDKLTLTTASPTYATGVFTVNLRPPTAKGEFAIYATTTAAKYTTGVYAETGNVPIPTYAWQKVVPDASDEIVIVCETTSKGVSAQGVRLVGCPMNVYDTSKDLIVQYGPPQLVDWPMPDDAQYTAGWARTTSEARTGAVNASSNVYPNMVAAANIGIANWTTNTNYISGVI